MEGVREREKGAPLACVHADGRTDTRAWQQCVRASARVRVTLCMCVRGCVFTLMDVLELILLNLLSCLVLRLHHGVSHGVSALMSFALVALSAHFDPTPAPCICAFVCVFVFSLFATDLSCSFSCRF